eukprot:14833870-Ditylum_brightwellii.AAC.1
MQCIATEIHSCNTNEDEDHTEDEESKEEGKENVNKESKEKKLKTKVRRKMIRAKKKILTMNLYQILLSVHHPSK